MEESSKDDDDAASLDHCNDSSSLDSYLNHFGDLMEIGDEVTVNTDFPLTYHHDYTDHSYISTSSRAAQKSLCSTTTIRFNDHDCISEETTGLSEFHELFDYPAFAFDLQEQVIESSRSEETSEEVNNDDDDGLNQTQSHLWMYSGLDEENCDHEEDEEEEEEDDTSSGCESRLFSGYNDNNNIKKEGQQQEQQQYHHFGSNHHRGAFPHTYIPMAGDRRIRFCLGLQTIVSKIKALMGRTGATAEFRAEFENHVFTLDNADRILKCLHRSQNNSNNKKMTSQTKDHHSVKVGVGASSTTTTGTAVLGQDDHLYAATILTQTESSSTVRDHQYNEVTTTNSVVGNKDSSVVEKAYIPTRYARERWLRKGTTTIYTKMHRLKNRTGCNMALFINYQGIVITPKNYKDLEQMLEKHRPNFKLKKYNTEIIVQNNNKKNDDGNFFSTERMGGQYGNAGKRIETVMKVSLPPKMAKNNSFKIEFLKMDQGNKHNLRPSTDQVSRGLLQTVVQSDHDYDSQSLHEQNNRAKNATSNSNSVSINNNNSASSASSSSSSSSHHDFSEFSPPQEISISDGEIELAASSNGSDAISSSEFSGSFSFCSSSSAAAVSNTPTPKISKYSTMSSRPSSSIMSNNLCEQQKLSAKTDVSTSTDPCCGICGNSQQVGKGKFPNWLRCAHSLCHYLVHPHCLGFLVMNPQHLHFLPPYFCPTHREDGCSVE